MALNRRRRASDSDEVEVTVLRFGGRKQVVNVSPDATVEEAIDEAGYTVKSGDEVTVNGETCDDLDTVVEDRDQVVITPKYEGGK